jgi:hypothetical protein
MSCYEWEKGQFKIPAAQWASLKERVREAHNVLVDQVNEMAREAHRKGLLAVKGKRNVNVHEAIVHAAREEIEAMERSGEHLPEEVLMYVISAIYPNPGVHDAPRYEDTDRPQKPKKKFAFLKPVNRNNRRILVTGGSVSFDDDTRTVHWDVGENNRACHFARIHPVARVLFRELKSMPWTRGSGGVVWGSDEYHERAESSYPGGGGSYHKAFYGPIGEKTRGDEMRALRLR